jgi:hypothetical protein
MNLGYFRYMSPFLYILMFTLLSLDLLDRSSGTTLAGPHHDGAMHLLQRIRMHTNMYSQSRNLW